MRTPNTEMFKKIYDAVAAEPGAFEMSTWENSVSWVRTEIFRDHFTGEKRPRGCGTTRCVCGWAVHFTKPGEEFNAAVDQLAKEWGIGKFNESGDHDYDHNILVGARILGLSDEDAYQLFVDVGNGPALDVVHAFAEGDDDEAFDQLWAY